MWEKNHFCFDRVRTAKAKKLLLNLLVLVLMDLNRPLDGRGSNKSWAGWDESRDTRMAFPNRRCKCNYSRLGRSLPIIPVKKSKVFPNNKPWVSKHLKKVLNEKKRVYFLGDLAERKEVQRAVKSEIRKARENYKQKIELKFKTGDMRTVWDGIKTMSDMKQNGYNSKRLSPLGGKDDGSFAEDMNSFYSRFDNHDFRSVIDDIISSTKTDCNLRIDEKDVLRVFQCTNVRKSPGPDGISGQVLKNCATQLSGIFHSIFQASLSLHKVPTLWKTSIVVPVPKKSRPASPNDFRPVALTSHVMKSFENNH